MGDGPKNSELPLGVSDEVTPGADNPREHARALSQADLVKALQNAPQKFEAQEHRKATSLADIVKVLRPEDLYLVLGTLTPEEKKNLLVVKEIMDFEWNLNHPKNPKEYKMNNPTHVAELLRRAEEYRKDRLLLSQERQTDLDLEAQEKLRENIDELTGAITGEHPIVPGSHGIWPMLHEGNFADTDVYKAVVQGKQRQPWEPLNLPTKPPSSQQ